MRKADSDDEGGDRPVPPRNRAKSGRVAKKDKDDKSKEALSKDNEKKWETLVSKQEELKQDNEDNDDDMGDTKPPSKTTSASSPEPIMPLPSSLSNNNSTAPTPAEQPILPGAFRMRPMSGPTPADGLAEGERPDDVQGSSRRSVFTATEKEDTVREMDDILIEATLVTENNDNNNNTNNEMATKNTSNDTDSQSQLPTTTSVDPEPPELVMGHPLDLKAMMKLDASTRNQRDRFRSFILALVGCLVTVLIVLGIVLAVTLSKQQADPATPPPLEAQFNGTVATNSPTMAPTAFAEAVLPLYTQEALQDPTSPQARAYEWVQNDMQQATTAESMTVYFPLQRFVLATLYYSLQGAQWTQNDQWLEAGTDPCDWYTPFYGKICTTAGTRRKQRQLRQRQLQGEEEEEEEEKREYYHRLSLYRNNLAGTLPPEIGLLSKLDVVNLFDNSISGTLPSEIGLWQDVTFLQLVNNTLTGPLPSTLGELSRMELFSAAFNQLTGTLPTELGRLSSRLKTFSVSNNAITGGIPTEFGALERLQGLHLYENPHINGHLPSELGKLVRLKQLQLNAMASLSGSIPSELGLLGDLEEIQLQDTGITGTIPDFLGSLSKLTLLALHNTNLSGEIPAQICELQNSGLLREISVDCGKVQCSEGCDCDCTKSPRTDQVNLQTTDESAVAEELITDAPITVSAEVETTSAEVFVP